MIKVEIKGIELKGLKEYLQKYTDGPHALKIGILEGAKFEGGPSDGELIAPIAAVHEFGGGHVPPRSFLRSTVDEKENEWVEVVARHLEGRPGDLTGALTAIGINAVGAITSKIEGGIGPPLKYDTIIRKAIRVTNSHGGMKTRRGREAGRQSNNALPLVDTGSLERSIAFQVDGETPVYPNK